MRRTSTDASGKPRPVPFANKFQRIPPGTTGVTILEHLERLDAVEASLQRLQADEVPEMDLSEGSGPSSAKAKGKGKSRLLPGGMLRSSSGAESPPLSPPTLPTVKEVVDDDVSETSSMEEEDLVAMSKSLSHVDQRPLHGRSATQGNGGFEWIAANGRETTATGKKSVVVEVGGSNSESIVGLLTHLLTALRNN
jgi:hypothetical protein